MKKFYSIVLIIMVLPLSSLFAEISLATVLINAETPVDNDITIVNKNGAPIPAISGTELFSGDELNTNSQSLTLLILTKSVLLNLSPYTSLQFNVLSLGGRAYVLQIKAINGAISASSHKRSELLQVLQDIKNPQDVVRPDDKEDTASSAFELYVQIINYNAEIQTNNFDGDNGLFISSSDVDIAQLIQVYKDSITKNPLHDFLSIPNNAHSPSVSGSFTMRGLFSDSTQQYVNSYFTLGITYKKLSFNFIFPTLFTRDNQLYNPTGENDYTSVATVDSSKFRNRVDDISRVALRLSHFSAGLLTKITEISYGLPEDSIYLYFGDQHVWNNKDTSLFVYQYTPVPSLNNNLNKDFVFNLDFTKIGYSFRMRFFQPPTYLDNWMEELDIIYNRIWLKPLLPVYPLIVGVSVATDLNVDTFSDKDPSKFIQQSNDKDNKFLFYGADTTIPLALSTLWKTDLLAEFGGLMFITTASAIIPREYSHFGAKAGIRNTFTSTDFNTQMSFDINAYYSRGLFRPHILFAGYEYGIKPIINNAIAELSTDINNKKYSTSVLTPEIEFNLDILKVFNISLGANYPIILSTEFTHKNLYLYPSVYLQANMNIENVASFFDFILSVYYAHNYLNVDEWLSKLNPDKMSKANFLSNIFSFSHTVLSVDAKIIMADKYTVLGGIALYPQYANTEAVYTTSKRFIKFSPTPYIGFSITF